MPKDEKPWTPDQPIPDEDAENEVQNEVMRRRRLDHLLKESEPKEQPPQKGKVKKWGEK